MDGGQRQTWERKDEEEDLEDRFQGNSKLWMNRRIHKHYRIDEKIRTAALKDPVVEDFETEAERIERERKEEQERVEEEKRQKEEERKKEEEEKEKARIKAEQEKKEAQEDEPQPCTKEEYAIAKHLRFNTPVYEGRMHGMTVKCFIASEAVNCLLDSKWAKGKSTGDITFTDRKSCVNFCHKLMTKGLFHRADKVDKKKDKEKLKKKKKEIEESAEEKKGKKEKKSKKDDKAAESAEDSEKKKEESKTDKKEEDKKAKTKKFRLTMGEDQRFIDGNSVYVWIYDPVHPKTFIIGLFMVIGAAALCLFPLWPDWMRIGVYYCSLLGASFVGFMLFLIVFRVVIFSAIWILTLGRHHFWLFPNLTEDCGIIESFRPVIKHEVYKPPTEEEKAALKKKKEEEEESEIEAQDGFEMIDSKDTAENGDQDGENEDEEEQEEGVGEEEDEDVDGETKKDK